MSAPTVVVLAGGENSRFFPLNTSTHKGALTLFGEPLIVRTLKNLEAHGFDHVVLVLSSKDYGEGGLSQTLARYSFKLKIDYVLQPQARGMGDALLLAKSYVTDFFAVIFPTSLDAGEVLTQMVRGRGNGGALVVSYTQEPWLYGIVTTDGERVTSIVEKPEPGSEPSNLMVKGTYYLNADFLKILAKIESGEYNFEAALDKFLQQERVTFVEQINPLPELKYPWHLFDFQTHLFAKLENRVSPDAVIAPTVVLDDSGGPIWIEAGAHIGHATRLVGPCYIGRDVYIGDFSLIRNSSFEAGSSVGVHSDVTRSIVMEYSSMHNGFLGDSIVGRNVQIGSGLITSNKRLDRQEIKVDVKGKLIETRKEGLGTVIGDQAKIGIRTNIMPGIFVGANSIVYPAATLYKHIPHKTVFKG